MDELERYKATVSESEEKLAKQSETVSALKARIVGHEIEKAAAGLGFRDPDLAHKLIDANELELDDEGIPTNAEELLKAELKKRPYLGKEGGSGGSNPAGGANKASEGSKDEELLAAFPALRQRIPARKG